MKIHPFLFSFLLFVFGLFPAIAQESQNGEIIKIDSLKTLLYNYQKDDKHKVMLMNEYAKSCFHHFDFRRGLLLTKEARNLSQKINYPYGEILYYRTMADFCNGNLSLYYQKLADWYPTDKNQNRSDLEPPFKIEPWPDNVNYELELDSLKSAQRYFIKTKDKETEAHIHYLMLTALNGLQRFSKSDAVRIQALQLFKELNEPIPVFDLQLQQLESLTKKGDVEEAKKIEVELALTISRTNDVKLTALMTDMMAEFYNANNRYKLAIEYFLRSQEALEELDDKKMLPNIYYTTGAMYEHIEVYSKAFEQYNKILDLNINPTGSQLSQYYSLYAQIAYALIPLKRYDEATKYLELSLEGITIAPERENNFRARYFDAMGQILLDQGKSIEAIPLFEKSYDFFNRDKNFGTVYVNFNLAKCYRNTGDLKKSIELGLLAYNAADNNNMLFMKINSSLFLSEVFDQNGQLTQAYKFLKIHQKLKAEAEALDNANNLADIEIQTVLSKSNREIEKLEKERILKIQQSKIQRIWIFSITGALLSALLVAFILFRNNKNKQRANKLLQEQKEEIQTTLEQLEATQSQLIQSEKMASLGELTAGIAHEIQNPLNFVNNFSEVNCELIEELKTEKAKGKSERDEELEEEILNDLQQNTEKINHHGKRASGIVQGMLQHSRTSTGQKEPTNINALADEYLRLSYHGLRAKDKLFNADFKTEFDELLPKINIIPQDIGRVLLNLINNAFYAVSSKTSAEDKNYKPVVTVSTKINSHSGGGKGKETVQITISDNGPGIPQNIIDKIFQPFFTTKPTGLGTGLGLSLSYDILKAHGGELKVESEEDKGTEFIVLLPA